MSLSFLRYPNVYRWYDTERRDRSGSYYTMSNAQSPVVAWEGSYNYVENFIGFDYTNHIDSAHTLDIQLTAFANGVKFVWKSFCDTETSTDLTIGGEIRVLDNNNNDITSEFNMACGDTPYPRSLTIVIDKVDNILLNNVKFCLAPYLSQYTEMEADALYFLSIYGRRFSDDINVVPLSGKVDMHDISKFWRSGSSPYSFTSDEDFEKFKNALVNHGDGTPITPILPSEDISTPGGGDIANPDYNPFSDPVDFPGLPSGGSAIASGFIRVYNPTALQLQALSAKLWGNDFINTIHKIMNDPMEAMISLHSVPFQIVGGGNVNIEIGNFDTEVSAKTVTTQYYTLDCGNISLPEHWASALDYSPYTTVDIFIPFVGVRSLQIDDVMNKVLNLKYNIDILTGSAIAMIKSGNSVLYTYNTQIHAEIPYTMSSYGRLVQSLIGVAGTAIGATAGGAGAVIGGSLGGALGTAITKHSDVSRGGALGGAVGVMGDFTPYLIIHRPIQSLASDFASKKGYPSNISATLSSVSGFTVVDKIHLTGIDCTDTERDEIHALLKEGVII